MAHQDQQLQRIIVGLDECQARHHTAKTYIPLAAQLDECQARHHTALIVASDHGMAEINRPIDLKRLLQRDEKLDVEIIKTFAVTHIYAKDEHVEERALEVLSRQPNL